MPAEEDPRTEEASGEAPTEPAEPTEPKPGPPTPRKERTRTYVTLALRPAGRLHKVPIDPRRFDLNPGDLAVVETDRGLAVARVLLAPQDESGVQSSHHVRKVVRPAREPDLLTHAEGKAREPELLEQAKAITRRSGVAIEVLGVDLQAIGNKITLFFAAEKRVDFRSLVRELSQGLGVRVEMRQIGVRDEAKLFGALGHCGRELCCSTWLRNFGAVSIRMAKTQNLALSPNKVSGLCGRLMCCLSYEHEAYAAASKNLPKSGKRVLTCKGPGKVMSIDVLGQRFSFMGDDGTRAVMEPDDVQRDDDGKPMRPPPRGAAPPQGKDERPGGGGGAPDRSRGRPRKGGSDRRGRGDSERRGRGDQERGDQERGDQERGDQERGSKERGGDVRGGKDPAGKDPGGGRGGRGGRKRTRRSRKGRSPSGAKEPQS